MSDSSSEGAPQGRAHEGPASGGARPRLARYWAGLVLALIVASSALVSTLWVYKVPILQCPDEAIHVDYAFSIYSAGRLLNVRTAPSNWNTRPRVLAHHWERISHLYTLYLSEATNFEAVRREDTKVPPDYGTAAYFGALDRGAPAAPASEAPRPQDTPWLITGYPFGYYAALAVWMKAYSLFSDSVTGLYFWARLFSVVLLACALVLVYAVARELRFRRWLSLLLTAIVGFFPLTSYVSSCVQPDNLTLPLVLLCFYSALRARRAPGRAAHLALLGVTLGVLLVTKYHFYLCVLGAVSAMLMTEYVFRRRPWRDWLRLLLLLLLPSLLFGLVQLWVVWGAPVREVAGSNLHLSRRGPVEAFTVALLDYYTNGYPLKTFWSLPYGWNNLPRAIRAAIIVLTLLTLVLTFVRLEKVVTRLVVLARRGRWRWALRAAFSHPLLIGHFAFAVFMVFLYALSDNSFFAQGRHWFPFILPSFLVAIQYAPGGLSHRKTQAALSTLLLLCLALYAAVGNYYSLRTVGNYYYVAPAASSPP